MKKLFFPIFIGFISLVSCSSISSKIAGRGTEKEALNGVWGIENFKGEKLPVINSDREVQLVFDIENHRVVVNLGCNRLSGAYTLSENKIDFKPNFIGTRMYCGDDIMKLENEFSNSIAGNSLIYKIINEQLLLLNEKGEKVIVLKRK